MRVFVEVLVRDSKKKVLVDKFWEDPWSAETKNVLVNPKRFTKTCFITAFLQCRWGCLYSKPLFKSICSPTPTLSQHCPNNSIKNEIYVPPRRVVLPSSPHLLSVPAYHSLPRRLLPLWIHRFRQICPLLLRSQAESEVAYFTCTVVWWTRYVAFCRQLS